MDKKQRRAARDILFFSEIEERRVRDEERTRKFEEMVSYRVMFDTLPFDKDDCALSEFASRAIRMFDSKTGRLGYTVKIDGNEIGDVEHALVTKVIHEKLSAISSWCEANGISASDLAEDELDWLFDRELLQNSITGNSIRREGAGQIVEVFAMVAQHEDEESFTAISELSPQQAIRDDMMRIRYRIDQIVLKTEIECVKNTYSRPMSIMDAEKLFGVSRNSFIELIASGNVRVGREFRDGDSKVRIHLQDLPDDAE